MTFALSGVLQRAVYDQLVADAALAAVVGSDIFDTVPSGPVPDLYVLLGGETVRDKSDSTTAGAEHDLVVSVHCRVGGFSAAKAAAAAVSDALVPGGMALTRGRLVAVWFLKARAVRDGAGRRIDLTFRALVEDS
jgi:hypothetical protein